MTSSITPHLRSRSRLIDDVFQEGRPEACRDHEWHEGQQVMNVEDSGPRFAHWNWVWRCSCEAGSWGRWTRSGDGCEPGVQSRNCQEAMKFAGEANSGEVGRSKSSGGFG